MKRRVKVVRTRGQYRPKSASRRITDKDIKLPKGAFVAGVQRRDEVRVPGPEDAIQAGDGLIVIGPAKIERRLRDLFVGK